MCEKVKIQNNGDWICPKCQANNAELKENIKKIDNVLCNSCYDEFELDKEDSQNKQNSVMEEKLKQANDNIDYLINRIISLKAERSSGNCSYPRERFDEKWDCDKKKCSDCRNKYYNDMEKEMLDKYIIK